MSKKVISMSLSQKSIQNAINELRNYQSELKRKTELLVKKLAEVGITVAQTYINESPLGKYITVKTNIMPEKAGCRAVLIATGKIFEHEGYAPFSSLLAVEFGAGIHYNPVPNPKAEELGFGVGTFPNQTHAFDENGWWWMDLDGEWHHSYGFEPTQPMYHAWLEMYSQIEQIAKKVFRS